MDYIIEQLRPLADRLTYFAEKNSTLILAVAAALYILSSIVGICLFRKTKLPAFLGAVPIVRVVALFCYLGIFSLFLVGLVSAVGLLVLDVLAFTAPSAPELYYAFMPLFILPLLLIHIVFYVKLSLKFYMRWYHCILAVFLPIVILPLLAFGSYDTFDIRHL